MTEDELYRTSTQYRLWSFTPETLASLRATTNAAAADGVRDAFRSLNLDTKEGDGNKINEVAAEKEVDCLTIEEEQKIVGYYCLRTLDCVDFCEYPTNVKVSSLGFQPCFPERRIRLTTRICLLRRRLFNTSSAFISPTHL